MLGAKRKLTIKTTHGEIKTPAFLPDATYGSINSVHFSDAKSVGVEELVSTTLHLEQKLGSDYLQEFGGLHEFYNWERPILSDSGGFQVFSLIHRRPNKNNYINDHGAYFKDPVRGDLHELTPESSLEIQHKLGTDIRVVLDEPLAFGADKNKNLESIERTTKWAERSKNQFLKLANVSKNDFDSYSATEPSDKPLRPLLGGVFQGSDNYELRKRSLSELIEIGFDTYNFGGLPLKEDGRLDLELSEIMADLIPEDKIRYAMGIGTPDDIIALAKMGWDLFDCVLPTRNARHGNLYVPLGEGDQDFENYSVLHLRSSKYKFSKDPIASDVPAELSGVTRAYLRHLLRIKEPAGYRLATMYNLYFYNKIIKNLREDKI